MKTLPGKEPVEKDVVDCNLRGVPVDLWNKLKHRAIDEGVPLRELIIRALKAYVEKK